MFQVLDNFTTSGGDNDAILLTIEDDGVAGFCRPYRDVLPVKGGPELTRSQQVTLASGVEEATIEVDRSRDGTRL